jgi:hypothetical protein
MVFCDFYQGKIDPYRDWYPLGAMGSFTALADHLRGPALGELPTELVPHFFRSLAETLGASINLKVTGDSTEAARLIDLFDRYSPAKAVVIPSAAWDHE